MSLKAFHILFILAATLLSLFFGTWSIRHYRVGDASLFELILGIASLGLSVLLIGYGRYFLRKLKHISYL